MTIPFPAGVKTVDKFGISVSGSQGQGPMLQPRLKYRFRVLFLGFGGASNTSDPITLNINTCKLPTLKHETVTVHSYNSIAYFAGKSSWEEISMVVRDTVDNTVTKSIAAQLQMQMDHYNQTGYRAGQNYKFTTIIQLLDGNYDTSSASWTLEGCYLTSSDYGELDYAGGADMQMITLGIRYDNAILESSDGYGSVMTIPATDTLGNFINS